MKKKCTNSKCRKTFSISIKTSSCPYCGKEYPRMKGKNSLLALKDKSLDAAIMNKYIGRNLMSMLKRKSGIWIITTRSMIGVIGVVRRFTPLGKWDLMDVIRYIESAPALIDMNHISYSYDKNQSPKREEIIKYGKEMTAVDMFCMELEKAGCFYIRTDQM